MTSPADGEAATAKRSRLPKLILALALGAGLLLAALIGGARYGVLLPQARLLIEARSDGLELGRLGKLKIEGLSGDVWRDFRIRRLTIRDEQGVWLEAHDVRLQWRYGELLLRRFRADRIEAQSVRLIRRPTLVPKGPPSGALPVSFVIDQAHGRIEMLPAFSVERGLYDLDLMLIVRRGGGARGLIRADSQLHAGDHLNLQFDVDKARPLLVSADVAEAQGGALAGALGLPANQPFLLRATADGRTSAGRIVALAVSGAERPLEATGRWSPQGGEGTGRLSLTASSLTRSWAARLGPEVRFAGSGRPGAQGFYALDLRAASENLTAHAQGLGDVGKRRIGPGGVRIEAGTAALSRLTGAPVQGPARLAGVLTEARAGWRFAGALAAERLVLGGYGLSQVSGPVALSHDAQGFSLQSNLQGRGGQGAGWVTALLGTAPKAIVEGSRTADGRWLLRRLDLTGSGLKLEATGARGLLGALSFKGEAQVSNLAAAREGAAGAAHIAFSAAQSKGGAPWSFKADGQAQRFATGYPELDRLLGARPKAALQAAWQGGRLSVARANLEGAALEASSAGALGPGGQLALKLAWSASGPFHAGPVEISGKATGGGAITGSLNAPRADLTAQLAALDFPRLPLTNARLTLRFQSQPDGSSGIISAVAQSAYGPARGRADFRFPAGGVELTGLSVDAGGVKADGALSLRRNAPSSANLTLAATRGAFLEAGRVAGTLKILDTPAGSRAQILLSAEQAQIPGAPVALTRARFSADGPLSRLPYSLQANGLATAGRFEVDGRGVVSLGSPGYAASFEGTGRLGGRGLRTLEPALFRLSGGERTARLRLAASDGGQIALDGRFGAQAAEVQANLAGVSLGLLNEDLAGRVDANLNLAGRGERLDGAMTAKLSGARGRGAPAASGVDGTVQGRLADSTLSLDAAATNAQGLRANASLVLPTAASAAPFRVAIARQQPMRGRFFADGEVRPLWDLLVGGERSLAGRVRLQGELAGSLADPQATGQASVAGGRFDDGATGLSLRNVVVQAAFARDAVDVTQASGDDGHGGRISGQGRIGLARDGVSSFRLDLHGFRLIDNEQATASASGQATIARAASGQVRLSGDLAIDRADVAARLPNGSSVVSMDVVEKNRPPELALNAAALAPPVRRAGGGWGLDVRLRAPARVYLRGRGLNVELSLDAHVGGSTADPQLTGVARVVRGDYDFAGKRFEFDETSVVYLATHARDIRLDLTATRDDPALTAIARIRGTAAKPEVTFTSRPSLPSDEVLSQVLFGASASQLSPVEAAQLASAVSGLASGGGLDVLGELRAFAGLDRLAFGGAQASGVTVSGGKYIGDNVYLELTGGGREGPTAQVEWRVRRELSVISRLGGQGGARLAVRWRRDY